MKEYHKIETLFVRDMDGSKKLVEGQFRNPLVEYLKDNEWIFTEKVDGTNIRVYWDGHTITFGGRTDNAQMPGTLVKYLNDKFMNPETEQLFEQKFGETTVTLYGEGYGPKIQAAGGLYRDDVGLMLFDVKVEHTYLERSDAEEIAKCFGVDMVPVVLSGPLQDGVQYVKSKPLSVISKHEQISEGVVGVPKVRAYDHRGDRVIVKIKVRDFIQI